MLPIPSEIQECIGHARHPREIGVAIASLACAFDSAETTYISVPVTSGRLFVDWWQTIGKNLTGTTAYAESHRTWVIDPNVQRSRIVAELVQAHWNGSILNPAPLAVPHWTQSDYLSLFLEFIHRKAKRIVLGEGWELSRGCTLEATAAMLWRIPVFNPDGELIDRTHTMAMLRTSLPILSQCNLSPHVQEIAIAALTADSTE